MTLTTEQIKDIADDLDALGAELGSRDWDPDDSVSVVSAAAGSLVSVAAMRAPVPQQGYYPPPPYPYTPEDFSRPGAPVTLHVQVTGRTLSELKAQARLHGKGFFGTGDGLEVALSGTVSQDHSTGETLYTCAAIVRLREGQGGPRHPVQGSDTLPG